MTSAQLHQLAARLDGQGFEARVIGTRLFVIAPASIQGDGGRLVDMIASNSQPDERGCIWYLGEARRTEIITCEQRPDDGDRWWFYADGRPIEEASHLVDAALKVGGRLAGVQAGG